MILNEKQCSKNTLNLASTVIGKQKFSLELPQTVFQELLRYICNNLLFRITHFVIVMTCEGSGTSRYNISLESYFLFFLDLKVCGLWTFAQLCIAWLLPHPSPQSFASPKNISHYMRTLQKRN